MSTVDDLLAGLPDRHVRALEWFRDHENQTVAWPDPLPDGTLLVTQAKGIYKPEWTQYALSVRETLESSYSDRHPWLTPDGSWIYFYHEEVQQGHDSSQLFTNRGLTACARDRVPLGVMRQLSAGSGVEYMVLGLALVTDYRTGFFRLESAGEEVPGTWLSAVSRVRTPKL